MSRYIQKWLDATIAYEKAFTKLEVALENAEEKAVMPKRIRPATAEDIVIGAIIWYPKDEYTDTYWKYVSFVMYPNDQWKAYCAHDGCRYGLDGAFVEVV